MKRTEVLLQLGNFPADFHDLLKGARLFDSSCSNAARVWMIQKDEAFFLKAAASGSLEKEAAMTAFFHEKGFGPEVLAYLQADQDWLLTRAVPGEDCTNPVNRQDPKKLSSTIGELLRQLHDTDPTGCMVDRTADYIATAERNYHSGNYDKSLFPDNWGYRCPEEAWNVVCQTAPALQHDALLHGDYCLPNIILKDGKLSGFIDLGNGGLGDRHIDLHWGIWSLQYNLKTDQWTDRFLDAYGRDKLNPQLLDSIRAFEVFL